MPEGAAAAGGCGDAPDCCEDGNDAGGAAAALARRQARQSGGKRFTMRATVSPRWLASAAEAEENLAGKLNAPLIVVEP
jgi:hypothetical protein